MGKIRDYKWKGKSGKVYSFDAYTLDTAFSEGVDGNYIFAKPISGSESIRAVYIGEGTLKERIAFRINEGRVQEKGCDRVCVMMNSSEESRKQIEEDLLANNITAYEPIGCNIKIGG